MRRKDGYAMRLGASVKLASGVFGSSRITANASLLAPRFDCSHSWLKMTSFLLIHFTLYGKA